jgi:hypothetical protein
MICINVTLTSIRGLLFLSLFGSVLGLGCHFKSGGNQDIAADFNWSTIRIVSEENTVILIDSYSDTVRALVYQTGSFFSYRAKKVQK